MDGYMKTHGTSYYLGNFFFPKEIKRDVFLFYALVRVADDIVDSELPVQEKKERLSFFRRGFFSSESLPDSYEHKELLSKSFQLIEKHSLDSDWFSSFFDAMEADIAVSDGELITYSTYCDLQKYMYGSAEVIGLVMTHILGVRGEYCLNEAYTTARLMGEAMQYTNFLRDVSEDYMKYRRIYLPLDRLTLFGINADDIVDFCINKTITPSRTLFLQKEHLFVRDLYSTAREGIDYLHTQGQFGVFLASTLYEGILTKIEKKSYNQFSHSCRTSPFDKGLILCSSLIKWNLGKI